MRNDESMMKPEWRNGEPQWLCHSSFGFRHFVHHALAPIAQIGVRFACADGWPMPPATRALLVLRFRHRSARFFCLMDRQITHNEEFLQFLLTDFLRDIEIRIQNHSGFQRVADQFVLTRTLNPLSDYAA